MSNELQINGLDKSAILLLSLGEEDAAGVMRYLEPEVLQQLGVRMAQMRSISSESVTSVGRDMVRNAAQRGTVGLDTESYVRNTITKALGEEQAEAVVSRILSGDELQRLKVLQPSHIAKLIQDEHPQVIATILVRIDRDQAATVLKAFDAELRDEVILRIANLNEVKPAAIKELNEALSKILARTDAEAEQEGGAKTAAEILKFIGTATEREVFESITAVDVQLSERIQSEMFVFDNLMDLDDRSLQSLLGEIPGDVLVVAMKGAPETLRERIFTNMSARAGAAAREELESLPPTKLSSVEKAQKDVLKIVQRMAEAGDVIINKGGGDVYV
ncbi:MAG: flagellar motor switch protein FliG [Burkholderiales bacterium]|nr:flagellar motor switch protein FliG [Burkholderiales bacterium]